MLAFLCDGGRHLHVIAAVAADSARLGSSHGELARLCALRQQPLVPLESAVSSHESVLAGRQIPAGQRLLLPCNEPVRLHCGGHEPRHEHGVPTAL